MADTHTLAIDAMKAKGNADAAALAAKALAGEVTDDELLEKKSMIPTWRPRDFCSDETPVGKPYKWNDMIYTLRQQHDATAHPDWTPDAVPAMWASISKEGETGTMEDPITAARGMEYTYGLYYMDPEDNKTYLCQRTGEADGGKVILQFLPHELIGQYFEEVL